LPLDYYSGGLEGIIIDQKILLNFVEYFFPNFYQFCMRENMDL